MPVHNINVSLYICASFYLLYRIWENVFGPWSQLPSLPNLKVKSGVA